MGQKVDRKDILTELEDLEGTVLYDIHKEVHELIVDWFLETFDLTRRVDGPERT